jgi:DNA-binding winged helix-turn-helix (wHTH) protein/serine/threonine protein kinase
MSMQPPQGDASDAGVTHGARWLFGSYELNEKRAELRRDGELLKIESKPLNLLMLFVRHPGELITKNDLITALWPGGVASDAMLGGCIARLRTALGDEGSGLIRNVFGHGYRFDGEPKLVEADVVKAPPKLEFHIDDVPPLRPNWRLVRRLGLSGDCWLAEHVKTRQRRVFKFSNDPAGLAALKREVTIYRLLRESLAERPCYVDLLDWNFDTAPWFIESEHCAGGSLQEWFTAQGGVERVPLETRIDLVIQIAEAVAEVHAVGVLHKDLKPANIFVVPGERPTIRLADFGSSGFHDTGFLQRMEITRAGSTQLLDPNDRAEGTLRYLAPEVMAGHPATVRADVFAIGVMLYQLVTGNLAKRPEPGWEVEIDDELLREDIGAAANGDPDQRLATAGELARRLRERDARRTQREAERAAAATAAAEHRRRDRAQARRIGLILAAASLVIGLIGTTLFALRANEARKLAEFEAARARTVGEFLAGGMFANVSDDVRKVRDMPIKELLDRAAARIPEQYASDPDTKRDLHLALGHAFLSLDYTDEMDRQFAAADALIIERYGADDERRLPIAARRIVASHVAGRLRDDVDRYERIARQVAPRSDEGRRAARDLQRELVRARLFLGQSDLAKQKAQQLLAAGDPADVEDRIDSLRLLGLAQMKLLEVHEARAHFAEALEARRQLSGPRSRRLVPLLSNLAFVEIDGGHLDKAEVHLREARAIAAEWLHESAGWRDSVEAGFALLAHHRGDSEAAIGSLRAIIERARLDTPENPDGASAEFATMLITVLNDAGRHAEAKALLDTVLPYLRATLAANSLDLLRVRAERVRAAFVTENLVEADAELAEFRTVLAGQVPPEHPLALSIAMLSESSKPTTARAARHPLLDAVSRSLYPGHPSLRAVSAHAGPGVPH